MKINLDKTPNDTIDIDAIKPRKHIVVGFIESKPVILSAKSFEDNGRFEWRIIHGTLYGNAYDNISGYNSNSIAEAIQWRLNNCDGPFEAFTTWQDALTWLLENDPARDA